MQKKILVVEDEKAIADILVFNLLREGYLVSEANNGLDGYEMAVNGSFDLILLDVMLPSIDGFEVLSRLRKTSNVPVIMLTAREEETDKVLGLEMGADDYITKPFSMRELMARIKANIRRTVVSEGISMEAANIKTLTPNISIDDDKDLVLKNGELLDLTARELEIVKLLASEPGKVFTREYLMENIWGYEYYGDLRAVDVAIRRLREKIEDNPAQPLYINTKRGVGYFFTTKN